MLKPNPNTTRRGSRSAITILSGTVLLLLAGTAAGFALASTVRQVHTCVAPTGHLRVVDADEACLAGEEPLAWDRDVATSAPVEAYTSHLTLIGQGIGYSMCPSGEWEHYRCGYEDPQATAHSFAGANIPAGATVEVEYVAGAIPDGTVCMRLFDLTADEPLAGSEHCVAGGELGPDGRLQAERVRVGPVTLPFDMHDYVLQTKGDAPPCADEQDFCEYSSGHVGRVQLIVTSGHHAS